MAGRFNLRFRSDCLFSEIFEGGGYDNSLLISEMNNILKADDFSSAAFVVPIAHVWGNQSNSIKYNYDEKSNLQFRQGCLREPLLRDPLLAGGGGGVDR